MDRVAILGAGGHGRDIACIVGPEFVDFYDDKIPKLPDTMDLDTDRYLIGVNDPKLKATLGAIHGRSSIRVRSRYATVGLNCKYAGGCVISPGAVLANDVTLNRHVHVGPGAFLVRCWVGDYSTIGPGALIGGDVEIGARVFIGIGSRVANLVRIGPGARIGAGSVVLHNVPAGQTWAGIPAKPLGNRK